jgi:hypothetical protein
MQEGKKISIRRVRNSLPAGVLRHHVYRRRQTGRFGMGNTRNSMEKSRRRKTELHEAVAIKMIQDI